MKTVEGFITACREKGLNVTYQRILIYKALFNMKTHPTAEEIYKAVLNEYPSISLATVYKTLETLAEHGLLSKVTELHDLARYDADTDPHHHLLCVRCRKVVDVYEDQFNNLPLPQNAGFQVQGYRIQFEGLCKECIIDTGDVVVEDAANAEAITFCGKAQA